MDEWGGWGGAVFLGSGRRDGGGWGVGRALEGHMIGIARGWE